MKTTPHWLRLVCGLAAASLFGCGGKADIAAPASPGSAPSPAAAAPAAPITVTTVRAQKRTLAVLLKATGTVTPLNSVDVKAQVSSVISKVHFHEGQFVKAGDLLFTLDARTDEANVAKARAQLAKDAAALADAQRQLVRAQQLLAQNFISQGALDTSKAQVDSQMAVLAADQAAIDAARVALSYARVTAPNAGRAGAVSVFPGSTVQANQTTLVTITQLDPIAVAFNLPQRNLPDALAALKDGGAPVTATLADGAGTFNGRLKFVDNAIDLNSGSVKVKAVFDNRDGKLWPGSFVDVSQTVSTLKDTVVVPQAAVIQSARGTIVYVKVDGKAVLKPVQVLYAQGDDAAVSGVNEGDAIVLNGKQNLRPGSPVVERAAGAPGKPVGTTPPTTP
ncbi:MAG: efflux RND transporter periplasmic adaptor subunit [Rhodoferax sp.]|uniref:efflux RND transporter periplasmic adaptor subunit n=1 Tax=Rhodoferax sp. TaxID=50421 RepID=UPI00262ADD9D|nr:efflux RND transporter periplasmic adaptor subunit [Rhodoferax sp.]MDD5335861.1 efflux RND transporter periplasmic adaptor subunit [Rhodoferax sp.]